MIKKINLKSITIPVGTLLYFPFTFLTFIYVWGGYVDMVMRDRYIDAGNIITTIISFMVWFLVTYFLFSQIKKECKKDKSFIILSLIPFIPLFLLITANL